jgi:hypothetical protein
VAFSICKHIIHQIFEGLNMVNTSVMRPSGRTYALNLTTSASAALLIEATTNDQTNYVSVINTGTGVAAIELANSSASITTPTVASTGNAGSFVLPPSMNYPLLIAAPKAPFYIKGISSGTNTIYITAVQAD